MERSLVSGERPVRQAYEGAESLYRDHLGRRVILDVEGSGRYSVLGDFPVEIEVDGCASQVREGTFAESVVVTARQEGQVEALAFLEFPIGPIRLIDTFSIGDPAALKERGWKVQNISAVSVLDSLDESGERLQHPVASHLNKASWRCPVSGEALVLRRLYDRFHGRQRARVLVDGEFVGWWYEAGQDRVRRWGISEFAIPGAFLKDKTEVEIAIDPPGGSPLFSVARYEIFALAYT